MRVLIITLLLSLLGFSLACDVDSELVQLAIDVAQQEGIQPELLIAVVWVESRFCPNALSPAGAIGLGQLMPGTAKDLGVDPKIPKENLIGSANYLFQQYSTFKSVDLALAAYNAGPRRVKESGGVPDIFETKDYLRKVTSIYQQLFQN